MRDATQINTIHSIDDAGIQLIETMHVGPGRDIALLTGHMHRLQTSAQALGYPWHGQRVAQAIQHTLMGVDASGTFRLRLLLDSRGDCSLECMVLPPTPEPVKLKLAPEPLVADAFWLAHKTTRRDWYEPAQAWLSAHAEYFDVVYCNEQGQICEGSRSNLYVQNDAGVWLTPPVSAGLLPGVMRQTLLDQGLVREAPVTRQMLSDARAVRVSNALRGWLDARIGDD
ncbi:aminotransferase class IV family protein [Allopusillimonas ginsengisoli]|uniref:aminotransferase class IV family protein n=1 Tax=Allopusillimonas ginsengisoli TaxID=453575 RepID=UPI0039C196C9